MRLLVRNRKPPALALMTEDEADVAAGAVVASLYKRFGQAATRKLFEEQETFESLGLVDDVEEVIAKAIGRPVSISLGGLSSERTIDKTAPPLPLASVARRRRIAPRREA
jgi:hypothetical protein